MINTYNLNVLCVIIVYQIAHGWGVTVCISKVSIKNIQQGNTHAKPQRGFITQGPTVSQK